jgi:N-acetylmuramoyl-L-alanine amidase CwlA
MAKTITTGFITDKINGITVNTSLKCNTDNYTNSASREVEYIVMHYTGNKKDTAKNNAKYFTSPNREASAHLFVDDSSIEQSVELRDKAWHLLCDIDGL